MSLTKNEVENRLCALVSNVGALVFKDQEEHDCFCGLTKTYCAETFQVSPAVIEFIEKSVSTSIKAATESKAEGEAGEITRIASHMMGLEPTTADNYGGIPRTSEPTQPSVQGEQEPPRHTKWKTVRHKYDLIAESMGLFEIKQVNAICWKLYVCGVFCGSYPTEESAKNHRNAIAQKFAEHKQSAPSMGKKDAAKEIADLLSLPTFMKRKLRKIIASHSHKPQL